MKLIKNFAVTTSLGLALIALIFLILNGILSDQIAVAIITAGATVFIATTSAVYARKAEREQIIEQQIRDKKTPTYEEIVKLLYSIVFSTRNQQSGLNKNPQDNFLKAIIEKLDQITPSLTIWSTDHVLKSWIKFREVLTSSPDDKNRPMILMFALEDFFYAVREDLGHDNINLTKGDILSMFINDVKNYL
jgi:hypothetical protein